VRKPPSRMASYERLLHDTGWTVVDSRAREARKMLERLGKPQIIVRPYYGEMYSVERYYWISNADALKYVANIINREGVYEVLKSPVPLKVIEPKGFFVQAKREGDVLYHTSSKKRLIGNKLDPKMTSGRFIGATTHPLRHPGPMPYFGIMEPHVFRIPKSEARKFKPCIYPISEAELKKAEAELKNQGFRIMTAEDVKREYGKDWYKYIEPLDFLYENEWRAFEPVKAEYLGTVYQLYQLQKPKKPKLIINQSYVGHLRFLANSSFTSEREREMARKALEALDKYFKRKWTWDDIKREAKALGVKGLHAYNKFGALLLLARKEFGDGPVDMLENALDYK